MELPRTTLPDMNGNLNTLPSAEQVRLAIRAWWPEGGLSNLIVNVLRRVGANLDEAQAVAQRLAESADRRSFFDDRNVEEAFEMVRASAHVKAIRKRSTVSDPDAFDPAKCLFSDELPCPQCSRLGRLGKAPYEYGKSPQHTYTEIKHGHLLSQEELGERFVEVRALMAMWPEAER